MTDAPPRRSVQELLVRSWTVSRTWPLKYHRALLVDGLRLLTTSDPYQIPRRWHWTVSEQNGAELARGVAPRLYAAQIAAIEWVCRRSAS